MCFNTLGNAMTGSGGGPGIASQGDPTAPDAGVGPGSAGGGVLGGLTGGFSATGGARGLLPGMLSGMQQDQGGSLQRQQAAPFNPDAFLKFLALMNPAGFGAPNLFANLPGYQPTGIGGSPTPPGWGQ